MADFLLGIDYGTGGAKACIIDTQGQVLGFAFKEYPFYHDKPGWSEHDPVLYWTIACEMIHDCLAQARIHPAEIRGVAVSSALPSHGDGGRDHNPIHRAYNLMDRRATAEVAWLKEHVGEARIQQLTGNRIEDHPTLVNLLWEKNNRPDGYRTHLEGADHRRLHHPQADRASRWPTTARRPSTASPTTCWANASTNRCWPQIGIDPALLPPLARCEEIIGAVTSEAAAATGLAAGTPVAVGQVDFNASCIAAGITAPKATS